MIRVLKRKEIRPRWGHRGRPQRGRITYHNCGSFVTDINSLL